MWLILLSGIALIVLVILWAPIRLICTWGNGRVGIRLKFLGLSYAVWSRDFSEIASREKSETSGTSPSSLIHTIQEIVRKVRVMIDNWDVVVETGRIGLRLLRRSRNWVHFESGDVEVVVGLPNPSLTGIAVGAVYTVGGILSTRWPQLTVSCRPDFDALTLSSQGRVVVRMRVWDIAWDLGRASVRLPWRGLRILKRELALS